MFREDWINRWVCLSPCDGLLLGWKLETRDLVVALILPGVGGNLTAGAPIWFENLGKAKH